MASTNKTGISLDSLNAVKASDHVFEFEYITPDGDNSGVFLSVLGAQSASVTKTASALINDRRRKQAAREVRSATSRKGVEFDPIESDIEFGQRLAAARLVGWRGINDEFTPENAFRLCQTNRFIAAQIIEHSDDMKNFMSL